MSGRSWQQKYCLYNHIFFSLVKKVILRKPPPTDTVANGRVYSGTLGVVSPLKLICCDLFLAVGNTMVSNKKAFKTLSCVIEEYLYLWIVLKKTSAFVTELQVKHILPGFK